MEEFVREVEGRDKGIQVNWQGLAKLKGKLDLENDGLRSWQPLFENLLDYLVEKNILTYSLEDSWTIIGGGFDLSPKKPAPHSQLYFTGRKDAEAYINAFYKHLYTLAIIKLARETS